MFKVENYFDLKETEHSTLFDGVTQVWEALPKIRPYLEAHLKPGMLGKTIGNNYLGDRVFVGKGTVIEPGVVIKGPAWIGENCEIRASAYIRDWVIIGNNCVVGNSCEFKNSILFNGAQVPHFNYVGDSILGAKAHLGAGVILSNFKLGGTEVVIRHHGQSYPTGLRKFGAIMGDESEAGCHAVLNPGSLIGKRSLIYPGVQWRGVLAEGTIAKSTTSLTPRRSK